MFLDEAVISQQGKRRVSKRHQERGVGEFYEFTGTGLQRFPVPKHKPLNTAHLLDQLGQNCNALLPDEIVRRAIPTDNDLEESRITVMNLRGTDDCPSRGTRLAVLQPLRLTERRPTLRGRRPSRTGTWTAGIRDRHGSPDGERATHNVLVRAAWLDAHHRTTKPLARRLPEVGRAADRDHRDEQRNRADRETGIQTPLE